MENNNLIPQTQNGFRKSKSCQRALAEFLTEIHSTLNKNLNTCCVLIDIKSAFDEVCPFILNEILIKLKIPIKTRNFILNLLLKRCLYFKVGNKIIGPFLKNKGVPQGCVLSPLLYNLYVSELIKIFNSEVHLIQYADDTLIYCSGPNLNQLIKKIELTLQNVHEYFNQLKLKISPEKTKFIIFTKSPFPIIQNYSLNVDGNNISPVKTVKYGFHLLWISISPGMIMPKIS